MNTPETPAPAPAIPEPRSPELSVRANLLIFGFVTILISGLMTGASVFFVKHNLQQQIEQVNLATTRDITTQLAADKELADKVQNIEKAITLVEAAMGKLHAQVAEQRSDIDRILQNSVSLKTIENVQTSVKSQTEDQKKAVDSAAAEITSLRKDLNQITTYINTQLYPVLAHLQQAQAQTEALIKTAEQSKDDPHPSDLIPSGIAVPLPEVDKRPNN